eukprot:15626-Heterococcus_DN1.PRE.1
MRPSLSTPLIRRSGFPLRIESMPMAVMATHAATSSSMKSTSVHLRFTGAPKSTGFSGSPLSAMLLHCKHLCADETQGPASMPPFAIISSDAKALRVALSRTARLQVAPRGVRQGGQIIFCDGFILGHRLVDPFRAVAAAAAIAIATYCKIVAVAATTSTATVSIEYASTAHARCDDSAHTKLGVYSLNE